MELKHYMSFVRQIRKRLIYYKLEEVEYKEGKYIHFKEAGDDIYIPLFFIGFINVYFLREGKITDVFRYDGQYANNAAKTFYVYHYRRNLTKILSNDNEASF